MQRLIDIFFSLTALACLSLFLLPIVGILRLSGEGKVLFGQARVGRGGRPFRLLKFATMLEDSPNLGTKTITLKDDPRVLPFGKFLRTTKINELPQLINILKGDMSIIGPRPQTQRCFEAFPGCSQTAIAKVRPGLSGVGSVVFRDEEQMMGGGRDADRLYDEVIMPYKGSLEEWYVSNQGLKNYFLLIFITAWVVVFPSSRVLWRIFKDLPEPPAELKEYF